jgi:hypothetical protein
MGFRGGGKTQHRAGKQYLRGLNRLRKNSAPGRKAIPQGLLKPDVFSIIYGTTKVVP